MKKIISLSLFVFFLAGCQAIDSALTTSGRITESTSPFDNQIAIAMSPALANSGMKDIQAEFGLFWQTSFENTVVFSVKINEIENFSPTQPLLIRVDGVLYELPPFDNFSSAEFDIEYLRGVGVVSSSTKAFRGNKEIVEAIINGTEASYRISLSRRYADGEITYRYRNYNSYIPAAFSAFLARVKQEI